VTRNQKNYRNQQTIARPAKVEGFGFWSGLDNIVEFRPAPPNTGITFVRADLAGQPRIAARIENHADALRRTTLAAGNASVEMVEHLMAALYGLQIDNCEVWMTRAEMPGFDGSSVAFVNALLEAGIVMQSAPRQVIVIDETIRVGDEVSWIIAKPFPSIQHSAADAAPRSSSEGKLRITYDLNYPDCRVIGQQQIQVQIEPVAFREELAGARTFLIDHEAEWLRQHGIGRRVTYQDVLVYGEHGPINNQLRFDDECVRHKTLDVIGDLALVGADLAGEIHAHRSGHTLNAEMVRELNKRYCSVSWESKVA